MSVHPLPVNSSRALMLVQKGLRFRQRGEARRALVALREACALDEHSARIWTLYAVFCAELGRNEPAYDAFKHALWLRSQARQVKRVASTQALIVRYGLDRQCA